MSTPDPLAEVRKQLASKTTAGSPALSTNVTGTASATGQQLIAAASPEVVFQRLRYFENLAEHLFAHIKTLTAQVQRTGTAPAVLPHFSPLKSAAGDFDPNNQ